MIIEDHYTFRVTRNQDIELEDEETEDLLLTLEQELLRRRFGPPVRLEIEAGVDEKLVQQLMAAVYRRHFAFRHRVHVLIAAPAVVARSDLTSGIYRHES